MTTSRRALHAVVLFVFVLFGIILALDWSRVEAQVLSTPTVISAINEAVTPAPPPFLFNWGTYGSNNGQFNTPYSIATDNSGNVYVTDTINNRIQKFTSAGVFVSKWGSWGAADGQFRNPRGITVDTSGYIYVIDPLNYRIQKFTSAGVFVSKWGSWGSAGGQFGSPNGIAVDKSGNVYVSDGINHCVQKFTSDGSFISKWGTYGSADGQFYSPYGIAVDTSGNVYVADSSNNRIQKFTSNGVFVSKFGSYGITNGLFKYPRGVSVDVSGNIYVGDIQNNRIQKFTSAGVFVSKWGKYGITDGNFSYPNGIATDILGNVYVADSVNHRIQVFGLTSSPALTITSSLPNGTAGAAYSQTLTASGGKAPYIWSLYSGTLPPGLKLSSSGVITGTLTVAGTYSFTIKATDSLGSTATQAFSIPINVASSPSITTLSPLPNGTAGVAYLQTLAASGGKAPYTWSLYSGTLPTGLNLSSSGVITGTLTVAGAYSFTIKATDSLGSTATKAFSITIFSITINVASGPLITTSSPLPNGTAGVAYSQTLSASGGKAPYTWSLYSGTLPTGLKLSSSGVITGTPTAAGFPRYFTIKATDSLGSTVTKAFSITIHPS
jgi:tripartite motif-containing protein 71